MTNLDQAAASPPRHSMWPEWLRNVNSTYAALAALVLLIIYNIIFTNNFLTAQTFYVNLTQVATIVVVATGMTLVIATGGIDLSVGSLMAIAGALAPIIFLSGVPPLDNPIIGNTVALIVPVLITGLFGFFNGWLITTFRIQPIIATLVLFIAGRGIAQVVTNGNLQPFKNAGFQYIGLGRPLGIPTQVLLMLAIVAAVSYTHLDRLGVNKIVIC